MATIATTYPPCPDCGRPTQLLRDVEETTRGVPRTWWCPTCTTHLRRQNDDTWDVLDLTEDGQLIRRATPWAGAHWLRTMQALLADDRLHATARVVGMALLTHADLDGRVQASLHRIGTWSGCPWRQAWRACRELERAGWITWHGRRFVGGWYQLQATAPVAIPQ